MFYYNACEMGLKDELSFYTWYLVGLRGNVRNLCLWSISSHSAFVHEAMATISGIKAKKSEQNVVMTDKRMLIDTNNTMKFYRDTQPIMEHLLMYSLPSRLVSVRFINLGSIQFLLLEKRNSNLDIETFNGDYTKWQTIWDNFD